MKVFTLYPEPLAGEAPTPVLLGIRWGVPKLKALSAPFNVASCQPLCHHDLHVCMMWLQVLSRMGEKLDES